MLSITTATATLPVPASPAEAAVREEAARLLALRAARTARKRAEERVRWFTPSYDRREGRVTESSAARELRLARASAEEAAETAARYRRDEATARRKGNRREEAAEARAAASYEGLAKERTAAADALQAAHAREEPAVRATLALPWGPVQTATAEAVADVVWGDRHVLRVDRCPQDEEVLAEVARLPLPPALPETPRLTKAGLGGELQREALALLGAAYQVVWDRLVEEKARSDGRSDEKGFRDTY